MASDEDARRKFEEWKKGLADKLRPAVERMAAAAQDESKQIAADLGEPYADDNKMFWATLYNVVTATNYEVNSGSPELRTILDLARTVTPRQRDQWADAKRVTEEMFDNLDGGEAVGRNDICLALNPDSDLTDRATVLAECARFDRVPASYVPAVNDAVTAVMQRMPGRDAKRPWDLPQSWAHIYSYVAGAIAARAWPRGAADDGGDRPCDSSKAPI